MIIYPTHNMPNKFKGSLGSLAERYIKGWIEIHVHIFTWDSGQYCALFYPSSLLNGLDVSESFSSERYLTAGRKEPIMPANYEVEVSVLINAVQFVKLPQKATTERIPSIVRLLPLQRCLDIWADAPAHPAAPSGVIEGIGGIKDRELSSLVGGLVRDRNPVPTSDGQGKSDS